MKIYVGNLPIKTNEDDLKQMFESFGQVISVKILKDHLKGKSRGFGFVDMSSKIEAQSAIDDLNGKDLKGKMLSVSEARPRIIYQVGRGNTGRSEGNGHRFK